MDIKSCVETTTTEADGPKPQLPLSVTDTVNNMSSTLVAKKAIGSAVVAFVAFTLKTKDPLILLTT